MSPTYVDKSGQRIIHIVLLPIYVLLSFGNGFYFLYYPKKLALAMGGVSLYIGVIAIIYSGLLLPGVVKVLLVVWGALAVFVCIFFVVRKWFGFNTKLWYYLSDKDIPFHLWMAKINARLYYSWLLTNQTVAASSVFKCTANLIKINLSGLNMAGADINNACLYKSSLLFCNLQQVNLSHAQIGQAYLQGANLSKANLSYASLTQSNLELACLNQANLNHADLSQGRLGGIQATEILAKKTNFRFARLNQADLSKGTFENTNFKCANLKQTNFCKVKLKSCDLRGALNIKEAIWQGACCDTQTLFDHNLKESKKIRAYLIKHKGLICN